MDNRSDIGVRKQIKMRVLRKFREGVKEFGLVAPGDAILIGLSGGKDSLALVDLLGDMLRRSNHGFRVEAVHVRMSNIDYRSDVDYLVERCRQNGICFHLREASFEQDRKAKRTPCFLCSWNRRKILFETAQELGCNKIALGHHQDDILHTALMNLTFEGGFSTMPCLLKMKKMPITIIRPLCKVNEADLRQWAVLYDYQPVDKVCPFDKVSKRAEIARVFETLQRVNPEFRANLWHALLSEGKLVQADESVLR